MTYGESLKESDILNFRFKSIILLCIYNTNGYFYLYLRHSVLKYIYLFTCHEYFMQSIPSLHFTWIKMHCHSEERIYSVQVLVGSALVRAVGILRRIINAESSCPPQTSNISIRGIKTFSFFFHYRFILFPCLIFEVF